MRRKMTTKPKTPKLTTAPLAPEGKVWGVITKDSGAKEYGWIDTNDTT